MALLKNRYQFVHYGVCLGSEDICENIRIEDVLNSNPMYRETIIAIWKWDSEGGAPARYNVQSKENYETLKNAYKIPFDGYLDDRTTPPMKEFKCGGVYTFICTPEVDTIEGGLDLPGFANTSTAGIPLDKTGLVTTECCITETQLATPLTDRYQFAWYGICSDCSNSRIEDVLNSNPMYRETIIAIWKWDSEGGAPARYNVQSKENYETLKNAYKIPFDGYLDDRTTPPMKEFKCGESYTFICTPEIDLLEFGMTIPNFTVNNTFARISNCTSAAPVGLKLNGGDVCGDPTEVIFPPTTPKNGCRQVAILMKSSPVGEGADWKNANYWDYISYYTVCNTPIHIEPEPTPPTYTESEPTPPTYTESEPTPPANKPQSPPVYKPQSPPVYKIPKDPPHPDVCPPDESELIQTRIVNQPTPTTTEGTPTPTQLGVDAGRTDIPNITWSSSTSFTIDPPHHHTIVDVDCTKCGFADFDQVIGCPPPTETFHQPPPPTETFHQPPPPPTHTESEPIPPTHTESPPPPPTHTESPPPPPTHTESEPITPTTTHPCPWFDCEGVCEGPSETDCAGDCNGDARLDCLGVCNGVATEDCAGDCNGNTVLDCLGVCDGDATLDCAGICDGDTKFDCLGVCGGDAVVDACGECNGGETNPDNCDCSRDCLGVCDGDATLDCAGICNGNTPLDCAGICNGDTTLDCKGECDGDATLDCAGICNGNTSTDCAGVCGGDAVLDCTGECDGAATLDCAGICNGNTPVDCVGECGGSAREDCAGICNGDTKIDCEGVCDGDATEDCAGICNGNTLVDCNGICDGDGILDCAGICDGDTKFDCLGVCGGDAVVDACGECNGGETNPDNCDCNKDCAGICDGNTQLDCLGICGGTAVFDCNGICGGTDFFDCLGVCGGNATLDCANKCNGDAKLDCKGKCNGDAKLDCRGKCDGNAKLDCAGKCDGDAKKDCKGVCNGKAKLDCKGVCDGNAKVDCKGVCGGTAVVDCAGVCGGNAIRDCSGRCNGNARRDCAGICRGNTRRDICGTCGGNAQNIEDCCTNCEEAPGQGHWFRHGMGWKGTPLELAKVKLKGHSAPVYDLGNNTYRIYGDLKKESGPVASAVLDLFRFELEGGSPNKGKLTIAYSNKDLNDQCDSLGGRGKDSIHLRYIDKDSVLIRNKTRLITIQSGIISDSVTRWRMQYRHEFRLADNIDIRDGDSVYIRSRNGTSPLGATYVRGTVSDLGAGNWGIVTNSPRPFRVANQFPQIPNVSVLYVLNRVAVPESGGGDANGCDRGDKLLPGENEIYKFKVGDQITIRNRATTQRGWTHNITELNEVKGTIDIDGELTSHIQWWTFDESGRTRTHVVQQEQYVFDTMPEIENKTTPCMIRIESRTRVQPMWEETDQNGQGGTTLVFDGRTNGKTWTIHRINGDNSKIFYIKPDSDDKSESMLCSECSCAFRLRRTEFQREGPDIGPRSACAVDGNGVRNHQIITEEYASINPFLINDKLAIKTRDPALLEGEAEFRPYMAGYMGQAVGANIVARRLIQIIGANRIDYIEFESGDYQS